MLPVVDHNRVKTAFCRPENWGRIGGKDVDLNTTLLCGSMSTRIIFLTKLNLSYDTVMSLMVYISICCLFHILTHLAFRANGNKS